MKQKHLNYLSKILAIFLCLNLCIYIAPINLFQTKTAFTITKTQLDNNEQLSLNLNNEQVNALSWAEPLQLSDDDDTHSFHPEIVSDSKGNLFVVWSSSYPSHDIYFRKYSIENSTWLKPIVISNESLDGLSTYPKLAVDSNDGIHVIWRESNINTSVFYRNLFDNTWSNCYTLAYCEDNTISHDLISDSSGIIHFVWNDFSLINYNLFYRAFSLSNHSFTKTIQITNSTWASLNPSLATDSSDNLHLVWSDKGITVNKSEIHYANINDQTGLINNSLVLSIEDNIRSSHPIISCDYNSLIHVVWHDENNIQYRSRINEIWYEAMMISSDNHFASSPEIISNKINDTYIIWHESRNIKWLKVRNFTAIGDSEQIFSYDSILENPKGVINNNNTIHIIWSDYSLNSQWEIYYIKNETLIHKPNKIPLIISIITPLTLFTLLVWIIIKTFQNKKTL
ncbi:MAG: hypothetical protein ACTSO7_05155 [Candidatus Heimdallarchaeota archaeon]